MATDGAFRLDGMTTFSLEERGKLEALVHAMGVDVDLDRVVIELRGLGGGTSESITSPHPAVRRHWAELKRLQQRTAYRHRKVTPIFKAPKPKRDPNSIVECPACQNVFYEDCEFCDGAGCVTARKAEEWTVPQNAAPSSP